MEWFFILVIIVVIALGVLASTGRLGAMPDKVDDRPVPDLPAAQLSSGDLENLHFAVVARGYHMQQVDAVLDRIAKQLSGEDTPTPGAQLPDSDPYWKWSVEPGSWTPEQTNPDDNGSGTEDLRDNSSEYRP